MCPSQTRQIWEGMKSLSGKMIEWQLLSSVCGRVCVGQQKASIEALTNLNNFTELYLLSVLNSLLRHFSPHPSLHHLCLSDGRIHSLLLLLLLSLHSCHTEAVCLELRSISLSHSSLGLEIMEALCVSRISRPRISFSSLAGLWHHLVAEKGKWRR